MIRVDMVAIFEVVSHVGICEEGGGQESEEARSISRRCSGVSGRDGGGGGGPLPVAVEPGGGGGGGGGNTRPLSLPSAATPNKRSANTLVFIRF